MHKGTGVILTLAALLPLAMKRFSKRSDRLNLNLMLNRIKKAQEANDKIKNKEKATYLSKWVDPLVIVTVVLAIATYALYREATNQGEISRQAANAATVAAYQSMKSNELLKKSNESQLEAFKETQREFESVNTPFLEVKNIKVRNFRLGEVFTMEWQITNMGNQLIKILDGKMACMFDTLKNVNKLQAIEFTGYRGTYPINSYVRTNEPILSTLKIDTLASDCYAQMVWHKKFFIYLFGKIKYENTITGVIREYEYNIQCTPTENNVGDSSTLETYMLTNRNYELLPKKK